MGGNNQLTATECGIKEDLNSLFFPCFSKFPTMSIVLFRQAFLCVRNMHSAALRKKGFFIKIY